MIVVDIETSGGFAPEKVGIWQIGALEFEQPANTFLQESRIDDSDIVEDVALKIIGKTEMQLRDTTKQSQKELIQHFVSWTQKIKDRTLVAQNTPFDYGFLALKAKKYGLEFPLGHRTFDLQTIAAMRYQQIHGQFFVENGLSKMNLPKILEFCGIPDERIQITNNAVVKQGTHHNGLADAQLEAEALSRLLYGKNLLPQFSHFTIPENLR